MAVILPHGALFRGGAEAHIRKYIIKDRNWLDAVIGLPANIFYGTTIPTVVLVFKKCRKDQDHILFVDASEQFAKTKMKNSLLNSHIEKIIETYAARETKSKLAFRASLDLVAENDYIINIPRYVDTFEPDSQIDLSVISGELSKAHAREIEADKSISKFCMELGIEAPI